MPDLNLIMLGVLLSTAIGGLAYWRGSLTRSGWLGAVLTGTLTLGFGGWAWGTALVAFFVSSSLLSRYKARLKAQRTGQMFAKGSQRDLGQALANGGVGALLALASGLSGEPPLLLAAFAGVLATVTADTWATELGILSPHPPRLITTGQPVLTGTSGGVSAVGTAASAGGAFVSTAVLLLVLAFEHPGPPVWWLLPAGVLGGVLGSLLDSLLGATLQALYQAPDGSSTEKSHAPDGTAHTHVRGLRWLTNDLVNVISSIGGGVLAVGCAGLLGGLG